MQLIALSHAQSSAKLCIILFLTPLWTKGSPTFPGDRLGIKGDIAELMLDGAHRFLDRELQQAAKARSENQQKTSDKEYRDRLANILGVVDNQIQDTKSELISTMLDTTAIAQTISYRIQPVRWSVLDNLDAEGLLLQPKGREPLANVVAIPDADQSPESLCGLGNGTAPEAQFARRLAEAGCRVLVPTMINRTIRVFNPRRKNIRMSNREFLHRSAFLMGRTLQGYEIQKTLAAVDWFSRNSDKRIGLVGWGEGGMLTLRAAALDTRIGASFVSGHLGAMGTLWKEPLERNVFGLLQHFDDGILARLIEPRTLVIEAARGPEIVIDSYGAAPGRLTTPKLSDIRQTYPGKRIFFSNSSGNGNPGASKALDAFLQALAPGKHLVKDQKPPKPTGQLPDPVARHERAFIQIKNHTQNLLDNAQNIRESTFKPNLSSIDSYKQSIKPQRERFANEVIGSFQNALLPPRPRSRQVHDKPKWTGHEIVLDVFPDLIAHGILLVPKDLKKDEKRPVVVCQHGLEGRPRDTIEGNHRAYHDFAARLCERGYVVFAPQNPYLMGDRFRSLQRKANPLGKTLFSLIVPQHRQIVKWLGGLPFTDADRIAFYGLSYGGKTAMRVPALVEGYCLSICSADFNDWIRKTGSTRAGDNRYSYPFTSEYEIFEFNLGHTFNYAEMAALIAPRPFMVERGHFDGVAPDEWVAAEYAKVRRLYTRLGIPERTVIEWFNGPHTINGKGTFEFLDKWLKN
jgi:dienelactone hydrolase